MKFTALIGGMFFSLFALLSGGCSLWWLWLFYIVSTSAMRSDALPFSVGAFFMALLTTFVSFHFARSAIDAFRTVWGSRGARLSDFERAAHLERVVEQRLKQLREEDLNRPKSPEDQP
jgi:hypothetical protein